MIIDPKAADRAFLDDDQDAMVPCELLDHERIERFGEPRIGHRAGETPRGQRLGRLHAVGQAGAERQDRHRRTLADDTPLADRQRHAPLRQRQPDAGAAWIPHRARPFVERRPAWRTMCISSSSSLGAMIVMPGKQPR